MLISVFSSLFFAAESPQKKPQTMISLAKCVDRAPHKINPVV